MEITRRQAIMGAGAGPFLLVYLLSMQQRCNRAGVSWDGPAGYPVGKDSLP